ncbi:MAG: hypothetical protein V1846_01180 [Candidatus Komeilibacteria bacterium]
MFSSRFGLDYQIASEFQLADVVRDSFMLCAGMILSRAVTAAEALRLMAERWTEWDEANQNRVQLTAAVMKFAERLKEIPQARFSPILGRGFVYTIDGVYAIEVGKMNQPEKDDGTHPGMWMQGPDDVQRMYADDYPFTAVYERMNALHQEAVKVLLGGGQSDLAL